MGDKLALTFPGGFLRHIAIAATAGNLVSNITPGTGKRWVLLYSKLVITNDATVANRRVRLELTNGTSVTHAISKSSNITASQTGHVDHGPGGEVAISTLGSELGNVNAYTGINKNAIVEGADQIRFTVTGGQAGDSYEATVTVMEFGS